MKHATVVLVASMIGGLSVAALPAAQTPAVPAPSRETRELTDIFPGDPKVDPFALTGDGQRTYYANNTGELWVYDRTRKTKERLGAGPVWDLNLSPTGDALAYTKAGGSRGDQFVWVLALNPATGLAVGAERQLSTRQGDVPSISPDGKLVAFARDDSSGVGQSIVVAPIKGGTERVVAATLPSSVANIRWTPNGKTLFFGVNPPVACVPEWSCLPLNQELRQPPGTIRRVAVSGGAVTTVVTSRGLVPGLSPDGTTLMYLDPGPPRRWIIANADGTKRDTLTLSPAQMPVGWLGGSTIAIAASGSVRRLRAMSIADGQSQVLMDGAEQFLEPSWSPDGKLMMAVARGAQHAELRIMNADGSAQRTLALPEGSAGFTAWSPDQRWIAYVGFGDTSLHIATVEVATGRSQPLYDISTDASVALRWRADSRGLVLTETFVRQPTNRRIVFRTIDLDGKTTVLRELPLSAPSSGGQAIDETTALVMQNAQAGYRIVRLDGDTSERELPVRPGDATPVWISSDGKWATFRRTPAPATDGTVNVLEVARVDGSAHWTIPLPFIAASSSPRILPGADRLVVLEARRQDPETGVYLVSPGTQQNVRKLFTYASQYGPPELTISPDGKKLLYLAWETVPPSLQTMDLSAARAR